MLPTHQRLNVKHVGDFGNVIIITQKKKLSMEAVESQFGDFLAGVTDGDGCFSFSINKAHQNIWNCTFKITLSNYNKRLLHILKGKMGCGTINEIRGKDSAEWRIRDRNALLKVIVPLFHKHALYSTKYFYFLRWQRALEILEYHGGPSEEKHQALLQLKQQMPPEGYVSPHWKDSKPSDQWVLGFVEADGSFFITRKGTSPSTSGGCPRVVHSFGITQRLDPKMMDFLRYKFHITSNVQQTKEGFYKLETTRDSSLQCIKAFFHKKLRGICSLEYRIWSRSMRDKGNAQALLRVQAQMRKLRKFKKKTQHEGIVRSTAKAVE